MLKKLNNSKLYICIYFFIIYFLYLSNLKLKIDINFKKYILFSVVFIICLFFICIIIHFVKKILNNKKVDYSKLFILISIPLGIIYIILSPFLTGSDEHNHYYRIYEITEGKLITKVVNNKTIGNKLPSSLKETFVNGKSGEDVINRNSKIKYSDIFDVYDIKLDKNDRIQYGLNYETEYSNTALYSPISYIPQVCGFMVAKIFNASPFIMGMIGRFFNLLIYCLICFIAFKYLPKYKKFFLLVMTCPMVLSFACTLSCDGFTNSLIFLFISLILYFIDTKQIVNKKWICIFIILSILIANCKVVYFPLIFFLLLIPNQCFNDSKRKRIFVASCVLLSLFFGMLWMKITGRFMDAYYINTSAQEKYILTHPFWYMLVVIRTFCSQFVNLFTNVFVGNIMYHCNLDVYVIISILYTILIVLSTSNEKKKNNLNLNNKIFIFVLVLMILALTITAIYVQCTANFIQINNSTIEGLQGRYFIPLVIICSLLFGNWKNSISDEKNINYGILLHLPVFLTMFITFIG